jgi:hypothetical protein
LEGLSRNAPQKNRRYKEQEPMARPLDADFGLSAVGRERLFGKNYTVVSELPKRADQRPSLIMRRSCHLT